LKISVITAVYNSEATVGEAIASVAAQTHPDVEHLVVEGKSKDGSLSAIERAGHDRMRLISEPDKGIYDALNKGVRNATGDVVGFIHSDDFLAHDRVLSRIATAFEDPAVEAVFSDLDYVAQADTSRVIRHWSTGAFHSRRLKYGWMAQAQLLRLPDEDAFHALRQNAPYHLRLFVPALGPECGLKFLVAVEMVLDRPLVAPSYKDQRVDPCRNSLFSSILNERLVHDRQQLLWHGLGGR
jgi:glycosyltransferase involved in cell wall biosynthesis